MSDTTDMPIAIVGMSCRFAPNLDSPAKLWEFLAAGASNITEMPEKRWRPYASSSPDATAIMRGTTLKGSFLDDIEGFDADFFGISPKEAAFLDPQQRFMLELTWEALVSAGIPPSRLAGTDTGVYAAVNSTDYGRRLLEDIVRTGPYAVNGTTDYGIANRVSYVLDTRGPSMAVNTACAASLTAIDVAAKSLRGREIPVAVVGGLNIMSTPALNVALEGAGALAPDGRSKAYDDAADGYGRGEGAGVLVLKRLADATRDGDPVLALIRGGGVFQDGHSDGMMAPHAAAQVHMLRTCYERAGIDPTTVDYVEAHGTGTPTGDGVELRALAEVFGAGRTADTACYVGSVKPNIGHVEGGSGMAGVIKTVLALNEETLPPTTHDTATTAVGWDRSGLRLVENAVPWPAEGPVRRAGVSNYGVGGTISHLILEEAPRTTADPTPSHVPEGPVIIPLSSATSAGVRDLAGRTARWMREHRGDFASIVHTLSDRRTHLRERVAVTAQDSAATRSALDAVAADEPHPAVVSGRTVTGSDAGCVWVFSGHGAQWDTMGKSLLDVDAAFTAAIESLSAPFQQELGWTPRQALTGGGPWTSSEVQALTFAMQCGLTESWRARGLRPSAIIGHSVGEIAASVAAGALDLEPAARFACRRARALRRVSGRGAMAMVGLPIEDVTAALAGVDDVVAAIAASPGSTVISGDAPAVERHGAAWTRAGVLVRPVASDIAFHGPHVEEVLDEVRTGAEDLVPRQPVVPLYSTAATAPRDTRPRDAAYWAMNLRGTVRFADAVGAAIEDGHRVFLEVSSHPVVLHSVNETAEARGVEVVTVPTLRRDIDGPTALSRHQARLFCAGVDGALNTRDVTGHLLDLPGTAWQHRDYWVFDDHPVAGTGAGAGHDPERHTLLGGRMSVSGSPARQVWQTKLDLGSRPYPQDHELVGVEVTPAASIVNTFLEAAPAGWTRLHDVVLRTPLAVVPPRVVQVVLEGRNISLSTQVATDDDQDGTHWITHTTAVVGPPERSAARTLDHDEIRSRLPEHDWSDLDETFHRMGVGGYAFGWELTQLRRTDDEQLATLVLEPEPARQASSWAHVIDGALTISAALVTPPGSTTLWMSRHASSLEVAGEPPARVVVHSRRSPESPDDSVDVVVATLGGEVVCTVEALRFSSVENLDMAATPRELVHEVVWEPTEGRTGPRPDSVVVLGSGRRAESLTEDLREAGVTAARRSVSWRASDSEDVARIDLPELAGRTQAVVLLLPTDEDSPVPDQAVDVAATTVAVTRAIIERSAGTNTVRHLWVVTEGVRAAADTTAVIHSPAWGIGRIVAGEHPELWGGTVDLPANGPVTGAVLLDILSGEPGAEDVVAVTPDGPQAARLAPLDRPTDDHTAPGDPSGTVLVTGGLGALGLEAARRLVSLGHRRLVLAGRGALPSRRDWPSVSDSATRARIDAVLDLEAQGVTVHPVSVDVSDPSSLRDFLDSHARHHPPIRGIVHAAGVTHDDLVDSIDRDALETVMSPKAAGAWALHQAFPVGSLDFFVMFSSCGQFAHLTGQTAYAAANSVIDAIAALRHTGGESGAVSLGWTSWQGLGLSANLGSTMLEANARGLGAVTPAEAIGAWDFADRFRGPYKAVLRSLPVTSGLAVPPMFRGLGQDSGQPESGDVFSLDPAMPVGEQRTRITEQIRTEVTGELNLPADALDDRRPLVELGVDSVMAVALRLRLQHRFAIDFPTTILWAKPTVHELSVHVHERLTDVVAQTSPTP